MTLTISLKVWVNNLKEKKKKKFWNQHDKTNTKMSGKSLMFIYQTRKSSMDPGPRKVSYSSVSAETLIYGALVVMGSLGLGFSVLLAWRNRRSLGG